MALCHLIDGNPAAEAWQARQQNIQETKFSRMVCALQAEGGAGEAGRWREAALPARDAPRPRERLEGEAHRCMGSPDIVFRFDSLPLAGMTASATSASEICMGMPLRW